MPNSCKILNNHVNIAQPDIIPCLLQITHSYHHIYSPTSTSLVTKFITAFRIFDGYRGVKTSQSSFSLTFSYTFLKSLNAVSILFSSRSFYSILIKSGLHTLLPYQIHLVFSPTGDLVMLLSRSVVILSHMLPTMPRGHIPLEFLLSFLVPLPLQSGTIIALIQSSGI